MSNVIRFHAPLTCTNCGSLNDAREVHLYISSIGQELADTSASPGDVLELELPDFADGLLTLRRPLDTETTVIALEVWGCGICWRIQAARLQFQRVDPTHWRFVDATVVPLSGKTIDEAHFISRRLDEWAPNPGDDADRVGAIVRRLDGKS